jgi:hypothetical protein
MRLHEFALGMSFDVHARWRRPMIANNCRVQMTVHIRLQVKCPHFASYCA